MAAAFRVFLSAVTSEFELARDAVASDLQARDLQLRVQRSFRQEPGSDTLLQLLHDYIRECDAVVYVIGTRSGACPSPAAAAAFAQLLPAGISEASFTQWEFFFAREVLKEPWLEERRAKPIVLPYTSLGRLFKGREGFCAGCARA